MPGRIDERLISRAWLRSHEEDDAGQAVFRPATHAFPPARGRVGYEFRPDGVAVKRGPGPTDRTVATEGRWSSDDQGRITIQMPGAPDEVIHVTSLDADRLVVAK